MLSRAGASLGRRSGTRTEVRSPVVRRPSFEVDFWELASGEARNAASPGTFWIPSREQRTALQSGQMAKLIFLLEGDEDGEIVVQPERMWVFVSEVVDDGYIGILDNQPAAYEPTDEIYLVMGAEVPFWPEHIIDVGDASADYVAWQRSQPPLRTWPRG
jgi:hypothetical protein